MKFSDVTNPSVTNPSVTGGSASLAAAARASSGSGKRSQRRRLGWRLLGGLCWLTVALGACIIEEHKYSQQADDCWRYCDSLESYCTGFSRVYENRETCLATCSLMDYDAGDVPLTTANTLSCRLDKVGDRRIESNECPLVGPGGNGACGTNCQALCTLRSKLCSGVQADVENVDQCLTDCAALYDRQDMDASNADLNGDSVQCRLLHISRAALHPEEAAKHCEASQIRPTPGEDLETAPCSDPPGLDQNLECEKYCQIVTVACTDENRVFEDKEQCLDTCRQTMTPGEPGDQELDTIRCRRYHAYFSLDLPENHCLHASATGDGHCGTENCTGYCRVLERACNAEFVDAFGATTGTAGGGQAACVEACLPVPGGRAGLTGFGRDKFALPDGIPRYRLAPAPTGNNLLCRSYHAVEALTSVDPERATHCAAALGGGPCG